MGVRLPLLLVVALGVTALAGPTLGQIEVVAKLERLATDVEAALDDNALSAARELMATCAGEVQRFNAEEQEGDVAELPALERLSGLAEQLADFDALLALSTRLLHIRQRFQSTDDGEVLDAMMRLASVQQSLGDLEGAADLQRQVLTLLHASLADDDVNVQIARVNLALTLKGLGQLDEAVGLERQAETVFRNSLPDDHPFLLTVQGNLAATLQALGDLDAALALDEKVLAARERTLPSDHPDVLLARSNHAATVAAMGDLRGAHPVFEQVLAARQSQFPADHPEVLESQVNLAVVLHGLGDLPAARALFERTLQIQQGRWPADHPVLLQTRTNLAGTIKALGDIEGAAALERDVLASYERSLPNEHPLQLLARGNLAATLAQLGDFEASGAMMRSVLEASERVLPEDHPELLLARINLADLLLLQGFGEEAFVLHGEVLKSYERTMPRDNPWRLHSQHNLATTALALGQWDAARTHGENVLTRRQRLLPRDHPDLLSARSLLLTVGWLESGGAVPASLVDAQRDGMMARLSTAVALSPREARALARSEASRIDGLLACWPPGRSLADMATLIETRRHITTLASPAGDREDALVQGLRSQITELRGQLHDLVSAGPDIAESAESWRSEVSALSLQRDAVMRKLRSQLAEGGSFVGDVQASEVCSSLAEGDLAVGYLRYDRWVASPEGLIRDNDALLAMVFTSGGDVHRVELGSTEAFRALVDDWRVAPGQTGTRGRSVTRDTPGARLRAEALDRGRALRQAIIDPLFAVVGTPAEGATLHVCLDDALHLVPLEALPGEKVGEVLGDRYAIRRELSLARLLPRETDPDRAAGSGLLALGDVDFDAVLDHRGGMQTTQESALDSWPALPGTASEITGLRALYDENFDDTAVVLMGEKASKAALAQAVSGRRFVHLATHGWFAADRALSHREAERQSLDRLSSDADAAVLGMAPLTLCGLCLAGANNGRDALGRVTGLLTAEELAGFDLSACELVVLSACETNLGVQRAGEGILSLQSALHAAGAESSITSLWRVDDALTRDLMLAFYDGLWTRGLSRAEALWQAKCALRDQGQPLSAWAGWVLCGDPN